MKWRNIILLLLGILFLGLSGRETPPAGAQGQTRLVLAFYYAWYNPGSFGPGVTPYQPIAPYYSSDAATIQRHVSEARSAGIDGFVQSWYGPSDPYTNGNFQTLLNTASANGFQAAIDFEPAAFFGSHEDRAAGIRYAIDNFGSHPAYLKMDGKPVIFFWANWLYSVDDWAYIRSIADPGGQAIWIAEGGRTDFLAVFDGLHLYNIAWSPNPAGVNATWGANTRAAAATYGTYKYWVGTAMPGFDDRLLGRGDNSIFRDRAGGAYYQNSFAGAANSSPDLLIITSFNEWAEGSNIEASLEFGNTYLDLTAQLSSAYKSGGIAPPPPIPTATAGPSPTPFPTNTPGPTATNTPTPTPIMLPTPQEDGRITYVVQNGDTLIGIATRYTIELDAIYDYNNIGPGDLISIGQELIIGYADGVALPSPTTELLGTVREDGALIHQVEEGDTLLGIAVAYDLTIDELYNLNGLNEASLLQIGQELVVGQRLEPQNIGGSTDLPVPTGTATVPVSPTFTPTVTDIPSATSTPLVLETATPAGTEISANDPTTTPITQPQPTAATAPLDNLTANTNLLPLIVGVITLLLAIGGIFLYFARRF